MFNGIITHTGKIKKITKNKKNCVFEIKSKIKFTKKEIGSSVSCSGACLTLEKYNKNISRFYLSSETLNRTIFKYSKISKVKVTKIGSITRDKKLKTRNHGKAIDFNDKKIGYTHNKMHAKLRRMIPAMN